VGAGSSGVRSQPRVMGAHLLLVSGRDFDVVRSDLMMPAMSGMDLYDAAPAAAPRAVVPAATLAGCSW